MNILINYLYAFLTDGAGFVVMFLPFYLVLRPLYLKIHCDNTLVKKTSPDRELVMLAFFVFLVLLYTQTFVVNAGVVSDIEFIPFQVIVKQTTEMKNDYDSYKEFLFNVIGNIAIFIPVGFLVSDLYRKNMLHTAKVGLLVSLSIEIGQLPLERMTDIDDLILNTMGAVFGYYIYKLIVYLKSILSKKLTDN